MKRLFHFTGLLTGLLLITLVYYDASAQKLEIESGDVKFHGSTPIERFTGETSEVTGSIDLESGEFRFRVDLRKLDTGNSRRDRNMHEDYLETETHPYAVYEGKLESLPDPEKSGDQSVKADGKFILKGNTLQRLAESVLYWPEGYRPEDWPKLASFPESSSWADRNVVGVAVYRWIAFVFRGDNPGDNPYLQR